MESFKSHRFDQNPKEKELVEKFLESYSDYGMTDLIVFGHTPNGTPLDRLSEREVNIVLSTIQWLGSPVGQGFLKSCGFDETEGNSAP